MIVRVLLLAVGGYSPSRVARMVGEQAAILMTYYSAHSFHEEPACTPPVYQPKTRLDRWEWRNYVRVGGAP